MGKIRLITTFAQSGAARENGRQGGRPIKPCPRASHGLWRKVVRWQKNRALRMCPVCSSRTGVAGLHSQWRKYYPDEWRSFFWDGKLLGYRDLDERRQAQQCFDTNCEDEQAACDASLIEDIMNRLHYLLSDFETATCGDLKRWAK